MRDDVAFQSQQFAEQVAQRRDRYAAMNIDSWRQLPEMAFRQQQFVAQQMQSSQAQQDQDRDFAGGAQNLALDQLRIQQAREELAWAQNLHSTDMLEAQKRTVQAQADLAVAQAQKAQQDLESTGIEQFPRFELKHMLAMKAMGLQADMSGRRITVSRIEKDRPEEMAKARKELEQLEAQEHARYGGGIPDPFRIIASGRIPDGTPAGREPKGTELEQARKDYIDFKQATYAAQDARELAALASTFKTIGMLVDRLEYVKGNEAIVAEMKKSMQAIQPVLSQQIQRIGGGEADPDAPTVPQPGGGEPDELEAGFERLFRLLEEARKRGGK